MPRPENIPDCPNRPPSPLGKSRGFSIELITPMVGGGTAAGESDSEFPIRPTAIRGHLRHWWRVMLGHSLGEKMWQREEEIFGSTEFSSPLQVRVEASSFNGWVEPKEIRNLGLKYLLFPSIENKQRLAKEGITFQFELKWDSEPRLAKRRAAQNQARKKNKQSLLPDQISRLESEILQAVRAWLTFGGIGARTRRGCGTMLVNNPDSDFQVDNVQNWLRQFLDSRSSIEKIFWFSHTMTSLDAWRIVAETWRKFRQPGPAQRGEPRRRFPEAETIRRITGRPSRRGREVSEQDMPNGFPRAALGLPMIFQFKDPFDPPSTTVNRAGEDAAGRPFQRMASPFILKPFTIGKDRTVPMIVLLKEPRVDSVCVTPLEQDDRIFPVLGSPIADSPRGSAIEAFLKFIEATGFTEVRQ